MSRGGPPPVPGGRTPEEREQARREREARRLARLGMPSPPKPPDPPGPHELPRPPKRPEPPQPRAAAPPRVPPRAGDPDNRGRSRATLAVTLLGGFVALLLAWLLLSYFQPFAGDGEGQVRVTIPQGAGVGEIADILESNEVVSSGFFFSARARLGGHGGDLKPGRYRLRRDMSYGDALEALAKGPPPDIVTITIPEGRSRSEVREIVEGSLDGDYIAATRQADALDPRKYGARRARDLEGFLFPATYELKRGRPVEALVEQQLVAFGDKFRGVDMSYARSKKLTPYDVLIIASMVEREAGVARERRTIASVIYNRLSEGIPLGIDATIRFATRNWTRPLRESELASPSPYNTRLNKGLPPGPIGSPGLDAIRAAARPARTKYLFYVVKPGTCGEHEFSETDADFQRDVARYNRERERRGGRSPTKC